MSERNATLNPTMPSREKDRFSQQDSGTAPQRGPIDVEGPVTDERLIRIVRAACIHAESHDVNKSRSQVTKNWNSYHGRHEEGSKYTNRNYANRTKNFIPKIRSAVKKNMVAAGAALFTSTDIVAVSAEDDSDPAQQASAGLLKQILNYRLDRTNHRAGVPWFLISGAACQVSRIEGVCISKQHWELQQDLDELDEGEEYDENDPNIPSNVVGMNGMPVRRKLLRDRPMVTLIPLENAVLDMSAPFHDVIQGGSIAIFKFAMPLGDVKSMMRPGQQFMGGGQWYNIPEEVVAEGIKADSAVGVRSARGRGVDRLGRSSRPAISDFDLVWVHENFVRVAGRDWHFWSLGTRMVLSKPVPTRKAYPKHRGERPYVMGLGEIEAHSIIPMAPVEAMQPLQNEANDLHNLTVDVIKQGISPTRLVRRGKQVDVRALREAGPDATVYVSDVEKDVAFQVAPTPNATAFAAQDRINVMMDELSGSFSTSAVQSNRQLNETVGGMRMMSNVANAVQEYDLRVFIETWVEPVLRQIIWLIQGYETDETIMALSAKKAKLFQRFGVNPTDNPMLEDLLERQVTVKINVGIGAADPSQRIQKLGAVTDLALKVAATGIFQGQIEGKAQDFMDEVFGLAGYQSSERFFTFKSPEEAKANTPPPPEMMKLQLEAQAQQVEAELKREENMLKRAELHLKYIEIKARLDEIDRNATMAEADFSLRKEESARAGDMQQHTMGMDTRKQDFTEVAGNREFETGRDDMGFEQGMREREFGAGRTDADRSHSLADRKQGGEEGARRQELMLRTNEQNRALTDPEVLGAAGEMAPPAPMPPSALDTLAQGMMQTAAAIAQAVQAMVQSNTLQSEMLAQLVRQQAAPKRVVRDAAGQVVGMETVEQPNG